MPVFLFEAEYDKLGDKRFTIPDYIMKELQDNGNLYSGKEYQNTPGYKRLQGILHQDYNNPNDKDKNTNPNQLSFAALKRLCNDYDHMDKSPSNIEFAMLGKNFHDWAQNTLKSARNGVKTVDAVPEVPKLSTTDVKVRKPKNVIKVNGQEIQTESFNKLIRKKF